MNDMVPEMTCCESCYCDKIEVYASVCNVMPSWLMYPMDQLSKGLDGNSKW